MNYLGTLNWLAVLRRTREVAVRVPHIGALVVEAEPPEQPAEWVAALL